MVDLRYDASCLAAVGVRPTPKRVIRDSVAYRSESELGTGFADDARIAEGAARAWARDRLARLKAMCRAGCDCDPADECDGLSCSEEADVLPTRHRHSARW